MLVGGTGVGVGRMGGSGSRVWTKLQQLMDIKVVINSVRSYENV